MKIGVFSKGILATLYLLRPYLGRELGLDDGGDRLAE